MNVTLAPDTEALLVARAKQEGESASALAERIIVDYLIESGVLVPPILSLRDDDVDGLNDAIAVGEADFAAGRYKTAEQVRAGMRVRHGAKVCNAFAFLDTLAL
jgi:hypothetical protein